MLRFGKGMLLVVEPTFCLALDGRSAVIFQFQVIQRGLAHRGSIGSSYFGKAARH
jgi:hypothetical protein